MYIVCGFQAMLDFNIFVDQNLAFGHISPIQIVLDDKEESYLWWASSCYQKQYQNM